MRSPSASRQASGAGPGVEADQLVGTGVEGDRRGLAGYHSGSERRCQAQRELPERGAGRGVDAVRDPVGHREDDRLARGGPGGRLGPRAEHQARRRPERLGPGGALGGLPGRIDLHRLADQLVGGRHPRDQLAVVGEVGVLLDQVVAGLVDARGRAVRERLVHRGERRGAHLRLLDGRPRLGQLRRQPRPRQERLRGLAGDLGVQRHGRLGLGQRLRVRRPARRSASPSPIRSTRSPSSDRWSPNASGGPASPRPNSSYIERAASSAEVQVEPLGEMYCRTLASDRITRACGTRASLGLAAMKVSKSRIAVR